MRRKSPSNQTCGNEASAAMPQAVKYLRGLLPVLCAYASREEYVFKNKSIIKHVISLAP